MRTGIADHVGRESEIVLPSGKKYKLSRWTRAVWREFMDWAKPQIPDPLELVRKELEKWPKDHQDKMVAWALEQASTPLGIGSPKVAALMNSVEGTCRLLWLLLRKHQPEVTEDDAMEIVLELGQESIQEKLDAAAGLGPDEGNGAGAGAPPK